MVIITRFFIYLIFIFFFHINFNQKVYADTIENNTENPRKKAKIIFKVNEKSAEIPFVIRGLIHDTSNRQYDLDLIKYMIKFDKYEKISVEEYDVNNEKIILVKANLLNKIKSINFENAPKDLAFQLQRISGIQIGSTFHIASIEAAKKHIFDFLLAKGYLNAGTVEASFISDHSEFGALTFKINPGNPCLIEQVVMDSLISNIGKYIDNPIDQGSLCDLEKIKDSLLQRREKYWEEGYLQANVELSKIEYSFNKERAKIYIKTQRGPKTSILINEDSNNMIGSDFLNPQNGGITYSDTIYLSDEELRESLVKFYQKQGYTSVLVQGPKISIAQNGDKNIEFNVTKGGQTYIGDVSFIGDLPIPKNEALEKMDLLPDFFSHGIYFNRDNLNKYKIALKNILLNAGYNDAEVFDPDYYFETGDSESYANLIFRFEKNNSYLVGNIDYVGFPMEDNKQFIKLKQYLQTGDVLNLSKLEDLKNRLKNILLDLGYTYNVIELNTVKKEERGTQMITNLRFTIYPGRVIKIRQVFVEGESLNKERSIIRVSGLEYGTVFNTTNTELARTNILRHDLFSSVHVDLLDPSALDRKEEWLDIVIRVRAKNGFNLALSPGFGNTKGYRFGVDYILSQINEDGLKFSSNATVSQERQQKNFASSDTRQILGQSLTLALTEPLLKIGHFQTPFDFSTIASYQVTAESLSNKRYTSVKILNEWKPSLFGYPVNLNTFLLNENSISIGTSNPIVATIENPNLRIREFGYEINIDTRNNAAWPTQGVFNSFQNTFGSTYLGSDIKYSRYTFSSAIFFPLYKKLSGAVIVGGSIIGNVTDKNGSVVTPPASRRSSLTDISQVRGFSDSYGSTAPGPLLWMHFANTGSTSQCPTQLATVAGTKLAFLKLEARYRLTQSFGFVLFGDSGSNFFTNSEANNINNTINKLLAPGFVGTDCLVDNAKLITPNTLTISKNILKDYWKQAYASVGIGARAIIGNYMTVNLDYGFPVRDPANLEEGCVTPSEAVASSTPPKCVTRAEKHTFIYGKIRYQGAFHLSIGAKF